MSLDSSTKDLAWGTPHTALNEAVMQGRLLLARQLLAQGHTPDQGTAELIRKQDRLAAHALARQVGLSTELLPGSTLAQPLRAIESCELADRLSTALQKDELPPKRERGRL